MVTPHYDLPIELEDIMAIIDWKALNAAELPKWLIGLMSKDEVHRFDSRKKLARYLGQHAGALSVGSIYYNRVLSTDAPVLVTPIFIEMLKEGGVIEILAVAEFLEEMSGYWKEPELGHAERQRAEKILELIQHESDLWVTMLEDTNPEVRTLMIEILNNLSMDRELLGRVLLNHLKKHQATNTIETLTVMGIVYSIIQSKQDSTSSLSQGFRQILNYWIEKSVYPSIILANTACYLIMLEGSSVSKNAVDTLVNTLIHADFTDPMADLHLASFWIDAFMSLGIDQATEHLLTIFNHQQNEYGIVEAGAFLLELHFGEKNIHSIYVSSLDEHARQELLDGVHIQVERDSQITRIPGQDLTSTQKEILSHFIQKEQLWSIKTNLFAVYHFPSSQSDLEKLID